MGANKQSAILAFKTRTLVPGLLTLACLLVAAPVTAQVNYAVSGSIAYVTRSPNASGAIVIASTYLGRPVTYINFRAFEGCTTLTSVTIPSSVISIGDYPFSSCTSLTNLSVDAAHPAYSSLDGVLFNKAQTTLIIFPPGRGGSYVIPNSVASIWSGAFSTCTNLTSVTIPNNIEEPTFSDCTSLTSVIVGNTVSYIEGAAFFGCTSLTNFTFLGNAPWLVDGAFYNVGAGAKAYYSCGTTGWGPTYGELPTVMLFAPIAPGSVGVKSGGFGFTLVACLANQTVVVEASANLVNWQPIWANALPGATADFVDPEWVNHPRRFYRARSN